MIPFRTASHADNRPCSRISFFMSCQSACEISQRKSSAGSVSKPYLMKIGARCCKGIRSEPRNVSSAVDVGLGLADEAGSELVPSFIESPLRATAVVADSALKERTGLVSDIAVL